MFNRSRTKGSLVSALYGQFTEYPFSCANRYETDPAWTLYYPTKVFSGDKTVTDDFIGSGYWKRKKRGEIVINSFQSLRQQHKLTGVTAIVQTSIADFCSGPSTKKIYRYKLNFGMYYVFAAGSVQSGTTTLLDQTELTNLRTEVLTKCLADRQKGLANLVESLAELDKTAGMLRAPLENVTKFIRNFKKSRKIINRIHRKGHIAGDIVTFASSEWLRFRYGITPLMADVKAVVKTLRQTWNKQETQLVRSRASGQTYKTSFASGTCGDAPYFAIAYTDSRAQTYSVRSVYYDKYKPTPYNELGFTFHNIAVVAWELTKFSFVVDWFANVGDLLYANVPRVGVESCGGAYTTRDIKTSLIACGGVTDTNGGDGWIFTGSCSDAYQVTDTLTKREPFDVGMSGLVIKNDFRLDHFNRAADAMSLLSQFLSSISFDQQPGVKLGLRNHF